MIHSLIFFTIFSAFSIARASFDDQKMVKVSLRRMIGEFEIEGQGIQVMNAPSEVTQVAIPRNTKIKISVQNIHMKKYFVVSGLRASGQDLIYQGPRLNIQGRGMIVQGHPLPQNLFLQAIEKSQVTIVGVMSLKEYLVGVLASEVPLSWPKESLKAQVIAARSYALAMMNERKKSFYQLESSVLDQVYRPVVEGQGGSEKFKKAMAVVGETDGVVLKTDRGSVLKAFYHADCGGQTASAKIVFQSPVDSGVAEDSGCGLRANSGWVYQISKEDLIQHLGLFGEAIHHIALIRKAKASRVDQIELQLMSGKKQLISSSILREKLGFDRLKSTNFQLSENESAFVFKGIGYGHGVGLCQRGSFDLGKSGKTSEQILRHYYSKAQIVRLGLEAKESARYE